MKESFKSIAYRFVNCFVLLMCPLVFLGCATKTPPEDAMARQERYAQYFQEQHKAVLIPVAESALGTPYKYGGTTEEGFDCSGFVRWAYSHVGIQLPRTAREQSKTGQAIKKQEDLQVGDIVAFYNRKRGYHTGIYVGEGKFIHSPRRRSTIRVSELDTAYFSNSYLGARRLIDDLKESEVEAAQDLIETYSLKAVKKTKPKAKAKTKQQASSQKTKKKSS